MAMNDATKRKEPEPQTAADSAKPGDEKKEEAKPTEPDAKRLKVSSPDPLVVRKQVEYYLSDENLKYDKFFHEKITADPEGWLDMSLVISCNKMKALRATKEDVINALKDSKLEVKEGGGAVRRPGGLVLPALEARPQHQKKSSMHAHDGGVLMVFKNIPAEQSWVQVKEKLKAALPAKANLWIVTEVNDKQMCYAATAPFDNDLKVIEDLKFELGGVTISAEVCHGEALQQALKVLPKHIRERRDKESRKRAKDRNKPIIVGTCKFLNVGALRGRVKEILQSRSDGEALKPDGSDFKLIKALLEHHPKGPQKFQGLVGIKVDKSTQGENRCFFMIKDDGSEEDFSAKKCLDAIEANPPYAKPEGAEEKNDDKKTAAASPGDAPVAKEEKKEEAVKEETLAPAATEEKKEEAKKEETSALAVTEEKEEAKKEETLAPAAAEEKKQEAKKEETPGVTEEKDEAKKEETLAPAATEEKK